MRDRQVNKRAVTAGATAVLLTILSLMLVTPQPNVILVPTSPQPYGESNLLPPSREETLSAIDRFTDPSFIDAGLQPGLSGITTSFPNNTVAEYLETLSNLSLNLQNLRTRVQTMKTSLSIGNLTHATENVRDLERLLGMVRSNISLLRLMVKTMETQGWNSTKLNDLQQKIDGLQRIADEYSAQASLLEIQVNLRSPTLRVVLSNGTIFIGEAVEVNVTLLARNGTALAGRSVTITWGSNQVVVTTDRSGSASSPIQFALGFPAGITAITASFQPTGPDAAEYVSTYTPEPILIEYYPTEINAQVNPSQGMPLDTVTANGTLATVAGTELANRTILFSLANIFVGTTRTDNAGSFQFSFQVPPAIESGNQNLLIFFSPRADVLASTKATLPFIVIRDQTSASVSAPAILFSGTTMSMNGRVTGAYQNAGGLVGNVVVTLDGSTYATTIPVSADGTFSSNQMISLNTSFGNHIVQVSYSSDDPRVAGSSATVNVYVVNSATVLAVALFCGLTPGILVARRRRVRARKASVQAQREAFERGLRDEYPLATPPNWERVLEMLRAEHTPHGLIATSFRLVRTLLSNALGKRTKESETHWEFYSRVIRSRPGLRELLRPLVKLFEEAEYSPFDASAGQGEQAKQILVELHETKQM